MSHRHSGGPPAVCRLPMWRAQRKRPIGRRLLKALGVLILLCLAILLAAPYLVSLDRYRDVIAREVGVLLDRRVEISALQIRLFPRLSLKIRGFHILDPPDFGGKATLAANSLTANVRFLPLLARRLEFGRVSLDRPVLVLRRTAEGFNNLLGSRQKTAPPLTAQSPAPATPAEIPPAPTSPSSELTSESSSLLAGFLIGNLSLREAEFRVEDPRLDQPVHLRGISMDMFQPSSEAPIDVQFRASQPELRLSAKVGPINLQNVGATPLEGFLALGDGWLNALQPWLQPRLKGGPFDLRGGKLSGELKFEGTLDRASLRGRLSLGPLMPRGASPTSEGRQAWNAEIKSNLNWSHPEPAAPYRVQGDGEFSLAGLLLHLSGNGTFGPGSKSYKAEIQGARLQAEDLQPLVQAILGDDSDQLRLKGLTALNIQVRGEGAKTSVIWSLDAKAVMAQYADLFRKPGGIPLQVTGTAVASPGNFEIRDFLFALRQVRLRGGMAYLGDTLRLRGETDPFNLEGMDTILPALRPLGLAGTIRIGLIANGRVEDVLSRQSQLEVSLEEAAATLSGLPHRVRNVHAFIVVTPQSLQITKSRFRIGKTQLAVKGSLVDFNSPQIRFDVRAPSFRLDDVLPRPVKKSAASFPPGFQKASWVGTHPVLVATTEKPQVKNKVSPGVRWLKSVEGGGTVHIGKGEAEKVRFENLVASLRLSRGKAFADQLKAQLHRGTLEGRGEYALDRVPAPFKARIQLKGVRIERAVAEQVPGPVFLSGSLNLNANVTGRGTDEASLKKTLSAKGDLTIQGGIFHQFGLFEDVERLIRMHGIFGVINGEKRFRTLKGSFEIKEGNVILPGLRMTASGASLSGRGRIGFDGKGDLTITASFDEQAARKISRGMLSGLLRREEGKIEIPFRIQGDLREPRVNLDPKFIQKRLGRDTGKFIMDTLDKLLR